MFQRAFRDGNVWLALGMLCLGLFFGLGQWAGTGGIPDFLRGLCIGLAIIAYAVSTIMLAAGHSQSSQRPVRKAPPRSKSRR